MICLDFPTVFQHDPDVALNLDFCLGVIKKQMMTFQLKSYQLLELDDINCFLQTLVHMFSVTTILIYFSHFV